MGSAELHTREAAWGTSALGTSDLLGLDAASGQMKAAGLLLLALAQPCRANPGPALKCAQEGFVCFQLSRALICTTKY